MTEPVLIDTLTVLELAEKMLANPQLFETEIQKEPAAARLGTNKDYYLLMTIPEANLDATRQF